MTNRKWLSLHRPLTKRLSFRSFSTLVTTSGTWANYPRPTKRDLRPKRRLSSSETKLCRCLQFCRRQEVRVYQRVNACLRLGYQIPTTVEDFFVRCSPMPPTDSVDSLCFPRGAFRRLRALNVDVSALWNEDF
jgi:hypothetical protein